MSIEPEINPVGMIAYRSGTHSKFYVVDRDGLRYFTTLNDGKLNLHSAMHIDDPCRLYFGFSSFLSCGLSLLKNVTNICILGHGAGSNFKYFSDLDINNLKIDAVDIDSAAFTISEEYFCVDKAHHQFHVADAMDFIQRTEIKYDYILYDAFFTAFSPPPYFTDKDFIESMLSALSETGVLAINFPVKSVSCEIEQMKLSCGYSRVEDELNYMYFFCKSPPKSLNPVYYSEELCSLPKEWSLDKFLKAIKTSWKPPA